MPLYLAGTRVTGLFPISVVTDGMGLNITVFSHCGELNFGIVADREQVPDVAGSSQTCHKAGEVLHRCWWLARLSGAGARFAGVAVRVIDEALARIVESARHARHG